jgi:RNA polymerase sigma-70 factor (ECF subfamily)
MPSTSLIDDHCLSAARSGDERAWITIYSELAGPLLSYLRRLGANRRTEAEDLLGETFVQISRDLHKFAGGPSELRPWAFRIARNRLIDASRSMARRPEGHQTAPTATSFDDDPNLRELALLDQAEYQQIMDAEVLDQLLSTLTPDQREVIWLRYVEDLDTELVGQITGRSANAVAAMTQRALTHLHLRIHELSKTV